jgi:hypothetical protein
LPVRRHPRVELRSELAGILALAADSKKPGGLTAAGLAEQIKMVAGLDLDFVTCSTRKGWKPGFQHHRA